MYNYLRFDGPIAAATPEPFSIVFDGFTLRIQNSAVTPLSAPEYCAVAFSWTERA
jgi:hypothetical protein